jgi:hypothetical protein
MAEHPAAAMATAAAQAAPSEDVVAAVATCERSAAGVARVPVFAPVANMTRVVVAHCPEEPMVQVHGIVFRYVVSANKRYIEIMTRATAHASRSAHSLPAIGQGIPNRMPSCHLFDLREGGASATGSTL